MLTIKECARRLDCSLSTAYNLCAAGKLKHLRVGVRRGTIRVKPEDLAEFMKSAEGRAAAMGEGSFPLLVIKPR